MPIELGIWKLGKKLEKVSFSSIESEQKLEDILAQDISILASGLMLLGRQISTAHGKFIDLLAMDADGNLNIIELKKNRTPREAVAQLLDYASWVQSLTYDEISDIYSEKNKNEAFEAGFAEAFDCTPPDEINKELKLILVAAELDSGSERIINYLSDNFGVPINAMFFRYFKEGENEYLTRTWLIDPQEVESNISKSTAKKGRETWNGQDFYVTYGPPDGRDWKDAVKYGFVSGGGGRWYSRTLDQLFPGARVFVNVPGLGYVGVGKVTESVVPMTEFMVEHNGKTIPLTKAPLESKRMGKGDQSDHDKAEYMVRIEWIKTLPIEQAYWEKGMFANQNTVTKLRNKFTLDKLIKHFGLDD